MWSQLTAELGLICRELWSFIQTAKLSPPFRRGPALFTPHPSVIGCGVWEVGHLQDKELPINRGSWEPLAGTAAEGQRGCAPAWVQGFWARTQQVLLHQRFSVRLWASSIWEMNTVKLGPRDPKSETLGVGPASCFQQSSR